MYLVLITISAIVVALVGIWLLELYMIYPGKRGKEMEKYKNVKYAHRGLHDSSKAENSLSAFEAAKKLGFGIELDVRLSKDGELMVFHDSDLSRMVGKEGKVIDFTAEELGKMKLADTEDTIPTFRQVLDLIDGAVPLLVEIKMGTGEYGVAEKFVEVIEGYKGDFIVESFNPIALKTVKTLRPDILRGILSMEYMKDARYKGKLIYKLSQNLMLNFLMRPDFVAYEKNGHVVKNLRKLRRNFNTVLVAWTVKSEEEEMSVIGHGFDTVIFEGYIPKK